MKRRTQDPQFGGEMGGGLALDNSYLGKDLSSTEPQWKILGKWILPFFECSFKCSHPVSSVVFYLLHSLRVWLYMFTTRFECRLCFGQLPWNAGLAFSWVSRSPKRFQTLGFLTRAKCQLGPSKPEPTWANSQVTPPGIIWCFFEKWKFGQFMAFFKGQLYIKNLPLYSTPLVGGCGWQRPQIPQSPRYWNLVLKFSSKKTWASIFSEF